MEEAKKNAVLVAKRKSWTGEAVPVRISGRASTVIRKYGAANNLPFVEALDELLQASDYFKGTGMAWEDVAPYKSTRRKQEKPEEKPATAPVNASVGEKKKVSRATSKAKATK